MSVYVAGSINADWVAYTKSLPKPGETVIGLGFEIFPGGKGANQAVAAALANSQTKIIGAIGNDEQGKTLVSHLNRKGVNTEFVKTDAQTRTGSALIFVSETGENSIVVLPGANQNVLINEHKIQIDSNDIAVAQFEIPIPTVKRFFTIAKNAGAITILNPAPYAHFDFMELVDFLIVNESEFAQLNVSIQSERLIVTQGKNPILFNGNSLPTMPVSALDSTGAGDCFVGSFAALLEQGASPHDAIRYASCAATISTTRRGASSSMPTMEEVLTTLKTAPNWSS